MEAGTGAIHYSKRLSWRPKGLLIFLTDSVMKLRKRQRYVSERSPWWSFWPNILQELPNQIKAFVEGSYIFSPMLKYRTAEETVVVWQFMDRLFIRALLSIIKPLFPFIISPKVFHLEGPAGVQRAIEYVKRGISAHRYRYYFRIDIKSYYASINHGILLNQLSNIFKDERLNHYFQSIITIAHLEDGEIVLPVQGITRRSSLSPTFGAIYLSPLDQAFSNKPGVFYARFMDDVLLLTETKRQYIQVKKKLKTILESLKLNYSPKKTKMGLIKDAFHFLGVEFSITEVTETQIPFHQSQVKLHPRTCVRSLLKVKLMNASAALPQEVQSYLKRWATWWRQTTSLYNRSCLKSWVDYSSKRAPPHAWLGRGLLVLP